jgi:hypothetical protein
VGNGGGSFIRFPEYAVLGTIFYRFIDKINGVLGQVHDLHQARRRIMPEDLRCDFDAAPAVAATTKIDRWISFHGYETIGLGPWWYVFFQLCHGRQQGDARLKTFFGGNCPLNRL